MALTILEGSTFCICDERGDISEQTGGFFAEDTRFLSLFRLTMNGETPLLLSSGKVEHYSAAFYLRNPLADGLPQDSVAIVRERSRRRRMQERIVVENVIDGSRSRSSSRSRWRATSRTSSRSRSTTSRSATRCDAKPLPDPVEPRLDGERARPRRSRRRAARRRRSRSRSSATVDGGTVRYRLELGPRERWELDHRRPSRARTAARRRRSASSEQPWKAQLPRLEATLGSAAALVRALPRRPRGAANARRQRRAHARLPAAGMPWFMTVFGRDTLITSYQTLLLGPDLARGALDVLAELQATEDDPSIDAEPGKIVHEVRHGKAAKTWFRRYYGTVDATPLYLVLLSEVWRWTGDDELVRRLREPALARARLDRLALFDGWGVRLLRAAHRARAREPVVEGLGRLAALRRRPHRRAADRAGRGAGLRLRREAPGGRARARGLGRRRSWPSGSRREAADLQQRFDEAYWTRRALRAGARRRRRAGRLALLERRPPALERDRPGRARRRGRRRADGRRALVGLGRPHDVRATTPPTTRSRTTTEPSGPTTTP